MASVNTPVTHEGAPAAHATAEQQLRRSVLSCFLWEKEFYEDGQSIAERIKTLVAIVPPETTAALAVEARTRFGLRHAPLWLTVALAARHGLKADTLNSIIVRADEVAEWLALYWQDGKRPLPAQAKKGLSLALQKFDAYELGKYDRAGKVRLRDVLFMVHAKPRNEEQAALWKQLASNSLTAPDTWEVALSSGANKKETWERLLREGNLGYLALLRNLRGMHEAEVDDALVRASIRVRKGARYVLPFRYVAAARAAPWYEVDIDVALSACIEELPELSGRTTILVDVSGSMRTVLSAKADLTRMDAAAALASIVRGNLRIFAFSDNMLELPARRGMAGVDAIGNSMPHHSTNLGAAVAWLNANVPTDRLIVITDEQSHDRVPAPVAPRAYMINVASAENGIGYGPWTHIDGFSESVLRFIVEKESWGE